MAALLYFIPKFFAFTVNTISTVWRYLLSKTLLPNSFLFLLVVLAVPTIVNLAKSLFRSRALQSNEPNISSYKTDNFLGTTWKWSYITDRDMPTDDLWCFCPNCANRLVYSTDIDVHMNKHTMFICENCGFKSAPLKGDRHDVFGMVARAVERKVTTGEWKSIVAKSDSN